MIAPFSPAAEITRKLAEEGISLSGFSAAVSGQRVILNLAVDSLIHRDRVKEILEGWTEPVPAVPVGRATVPAAT